jgi:hypothetical protein
VVRAKRWRYKKGIEENREGEVGISGKKIQYLMDSVGIKTERN